MNEHDFYSAVAATDFPERYYALCRRFPVRAVPAYRHSKTDILQILSETGRDMRWDARDSTYSCNRVVEYGTLHLGFVIQKHASLEFWFWLDGHEERIGSNYAVIAHESAKLAGKALPAPPYPRPEFHSIDDLREILGESFALADTLSSSLERQK